MTRKLLNVNGSSRLVDVDPGTPLLWVLRDELGLTGTKYGCGVGVCGACVVQVAGEPVRSCITPVADLGSSEILTIEGLSPCGDHPVQRAWLAEDVAQCGYCQPAQMLCAAALLARSPRPDDEEIDEAMRDVVCRCGTYVRIRAAIHRAATESRR